MNVCVQDKSINDHIFVDVRYNKLTRVNMSKIRMGLLKRMDYNGIQQIKLKPKTTNSIQEKKTTDR